MVATAAPHLNTRDVVTTFTDVDKRLHKRNGTAKQMAERGELRTVTVNGRVMVPLAELRRLAGEAEPTTEYVSRQEVAAIFRRFADLLDGHELDVYDPATSQFDGRR